MKQQKKLTKSLSRNYYHLKREWVYKNIFPRIIADMFLNDNTGREIKDYKFMCWGGEPKVMYVTNKGKIIEENFYDMEFTPIEISHGFPRTNPEYKKPKNFDLMKDLASKLSAGMPFVRIDFFNVDGKVYFSEFTFYDWAGLKPFVKEEYDMELGKWIKI